MVGLVVHTEGTCSLDADSFMQSLRHFIARDDNGTNFVRAEKKLWKASFEQNHTVKDFLSSKNTHWIVWRKNPISQGFFLFFYFYFFKYFFMSLYLH